MIEIIPALDIIDGKCVRLTQGNYQAKTIYNENPLEVARQFEDAGIQRLHLVDLDGAKAKKPVNLNILEQISKYTNLTIDFGGGIQTEFDIENILGCGASQITLGSLAIKNPMLCYQYLEKFGTEQVIIGSDVFNSKIAINAWQDVSELSITDFLEDYVAHGLQYTICTDISKDGMLSGVDIDFYDQLNKQFLDLNLIASGGVASMKDIVRLDEKKIYGVIIGKALYEHRITLKDINNWIKRL